MALFGGIKLNSILNALELQICETALTIVKESMSGKESKSAGRLLDKLKAGKSFSNSEIHEIGRNIDLMLKVFDLAKIVGHDVGLSEGALNHARDLASRLKTY